MKRFLIGIACFFGAAFFTHFVINWISPGWIFDVSQKIKYPEYYSWRDGKGEFPSRQFWSGFNTDQHKAVSFTGKTHRAIHERFPLLSPVSDDDFTLTAYIKSRGVPGGRFAKIQGSMWLLEFNENGVCIDLCLPKG